jgi:vacuolar-type H+-ATPase subunit I/STV1
MISNWVFWFIGILTIPLGFLLHHITKDEKDIYTKFFPAILWILAIISAIFLTINKTTAIKTIYMFITILFWNYADKIINIFNKK